ncbi:hypothetical protein [Actinomyces vulturis]|uniref:hypothetical protein n=1 Tax=Actinomyces vulturis TaxID=1857645 RepID=UPI001147902A|nr:hypothetical protein [Actinomyces vulturis]
MDALNNSDMDSQGESSLVELSSGGCTVELSHEFVDERPRFMRVPAWRVTRIGDSVAVGAGIMLALTPQWINPLIAAYWLGAVLTVLAASLTWESCVRSRLSLLRSADTSLGEQNCAKRTSRYALPQTLWPGSFMMTLAGWLGAMTAWRLCGVFLSPDIYATAPTLGVGAVLPIAAMLIGWRIVWAFIRAHDDMRPKRLHRTIPAEEQIQQPHTH